MFTQIRPEGNVLFYTDKRTTITEATIRHVSRNFVSSPRTTGNYHGSTHGTSPRQEQLWVSYPLDTEILLELALAPF